MNNLFLQGQRANRAEQGGYQELLEIQTIKSFRRLKKLEQEIKKEAIITKND